MRLLKAFCRSVLLVSLAAAPAFALPVINSFSASPATINPGAGSTLSWTSTGAVSAVLTNHSSVAVNGNSTEWPAVTTTYTLTVTDASGGTAQQTLTVTVNSATPLATVTVDTVSTPFTVSSKLLGLSLDMDETRYMVGKTSTNMNPLFEQLLSNLTAYQNAPMVVRELADEVQGSNFANNLSAMAQLSTDKGVRYFAGINMVSNNPATAASQATSINNALPAGSLVAFELGNEPDYYYRSGARRASTWTYSSTDTSLDTYIKEYPNFVTAVAAAVPAVKLAAPVFAGGGTATEIAKWEPTPLNSFITNQAGTLNMVNLHYYPGSACNGATLTPDWLLHDNAVTSGSNSPANVTQYVTTMNNAGLYNLRIGELNSVACGGYDGASNTLAAGLWGADITMAYAKAGVTGINFFTTAAKDNNFYSPFDFNVVEGTTNSYTIKGVYPLYYGMLLAAKTLYHQASILRSTYSETQNTSNMLKVWPVRDNTGQIRVLIVNKSYTHQGNVAINLSGHGAGTAIRLTATGTSPIYQAKTGLTLGGQTFDGSTTGVIQGATVTEAVPVNSGVYLVNVPYTTAVLVTIP